MTIGIRAVLSLGSFAMDSQEEVWVKLKGKLVPIRKLCRLANEAMMNCREEYETWKISDSPDRDFFFRKWSKLLDKAVEKFCEYYNMRHFDLSYPAPIKKKATSTDSDETLELIPPYFFEEIEYSNTGVNSQSKEVTEEKSSAIDEEEDDSADSEIIIPSFFVEEPKIDSSLVDSQEQKSCPNSSYLKCFLQIEGPNAKQVLNFDEPQLETTILQLHWLPLLVEEKLHVCAREAVDISILQVENFKHILLKEFQLVMLGNLSDGDRESFQRAVHFYPHFIFTGSIFDREKQFDGSKYRDDYGGELASKVIKIPWFQASGHGDTNKLFHLMGVYVRHSSRYCHLCYSCMWGFAYPTVITTYLWSMANSSWVGIPILVVLDIRGGDIFLLQLQYGLLSENLIFRSGQLNIEMSKKNRLVPQLRSRQCALPYVPLLPVCGRVATLGRIVLQDRQFIYNQVVRTSNFHSFRYLLLGYSLSRSRVYQGTEVYEYQTAFHSICHMCLRNGSAVWELIVWYGLPGSMGNARFLFDRGRMQEPTLWTFHYKSFSESCPMTLLILAYYTGKNACGWVSMVTSSCAKGITNMRWQSHIEVRFSIALQWVCSFRWDVNASDDTQFFGLLECIEILIILGKLTSFSIFEENNGWFCKRLGGFFLEVPYPTCNQIKAITATSRRLSVQALHSKRHDHNASVYLREMSAGSSSSSTEYMALAYLGEMSTELSDFLIDSMGGTTTSGDHFTLLLCEQWVNGLRAGMFKGPTRNLLSMTAQSSLRTKEHCRDLIFNSRERCIHSDTSSVFRLLTVFEDELLTATLELILSTPILEDKDVFKGNGLSCTWGAPYPIQSQQLIVVMFLLLDVTRSTVISCIRLFRCSHVLCTWALISHWIRSFGRDISSVV